MSENKPYFREEWNYVISMSKILSHDTYENYWQNYYNGYTKEYIVAYVGKRNGIEDLKLSTKLHTGLELLLPRKMVEGERDRASMKNTPYQASHCRMSIGT